MRQLLNKIQSMINRCVLASVDNRSKNPLWTVRGVEGQDKEVEVFEPYGLTSTPPAGAEALRFALEGDESHCIAISATGGNFRPRDGLPGEVILYSQWEGDEKQRIHFKEEKQAIDIQSGTNQLTLNNEALTANIQGNTLTLDDNSLTINIGGSTIAFDSGEFKITIGGNTFTMDSGGFEGTQDAEFDGISVSGHQHLCAGNPTTPPIP